MLIPASGKLVLRVGFDNERRGTTSGRMVGSLCPESMDRCGIVRGIGIAGDDALPFCRKRVIAVSDDMNEAYPLSLFGDDVVQLGADKHFTV